MKLDKYTTDQIGSIQDRIHTIIDRLKKNKRHLEMYECSSTGIPIETDTEVSVIEQLVAASCSLEMILERIDK